MNIPLTITAGDTLTWTEDLPDYPEPTYTIKCALHQYGIVPIVLTAVGSGMTHVFTASDVATAAYAPGEYSFAIYAESGIDPATTRTTIGVGRLTVKPGIHLATATTDTRSVAARLLEAVETALGRAMTKEVETITIAGRTISYRSQDTLLKVRDKLRAEVEKERQADRISAGLASGRRILTRFGS